MEATISVRGIVTDQDARTLVLQRRTDGEWEFPGGRLEHSENVEACLQRELREETGLCVTIEDLVHAHAWKNGENQDRFGVYYRCDTPDRSVDLSSEHTASRWLTYDEAVHRLDTGHVTALTNTFGDTDQADSAMGYSPTLAP